MADAYSVDIDTGILSFDDAEPPFTLTSKIINGTDLLANGYGHYYKQDGSAYVDGNPFVQDDRKLHIRATVTFENLSELILTDADIIRFNSSIDNGQAYIIGASPIGAYSLVLSNTIRQWDAGGNYLGSNDLDGANVFVEIGAEDENSTTQFSSFGVFVVDKVDNLELNPTITISGKDFMGNKMLTPYTDFSTDEYAEGVTLKDIVLRACSQAGVTFNTDEFDPGDVNNETKATFTNTPTCKDIVGYVAASQQCNAFINADGECYFLSIFQTLGGTDRRIYIDTSEYSRLSINARFDSCNFRMNVQSFDGATGPWTVESTPYDLSSKYYTYDITLPPYYQIIGGDIEDTLEYAVLTNGSIMSGFVSAFITWRGVDGVYPGGYLIVTMTNGETIAIPIRQHRVVFDNGLTFETGCDLSAYTLNEFYRGE